jgi:hypothetical protein
MNKNDLPLTQNAISVWNMIYDKINGEDSEMNDVEYWDDDREETYVDVDEIDPANKTRFVQSHTYEHDWLGNEIMYPMIGLTMLNCGWVGMFFSFWFNIQGWYWDCLDNARTNLRLV